MLSELKQDLVHLESPSDGLNEDGTPDGPARNAQDVLAELEGVIPESRFEIVFHFRQVKVWAETSSEELLGIVEKVETKVD